MLHYILRMKLKVVLFTGTVALALVIFTISMDLLDRLISHPRIKSEKFNDVQVIKNDLQKMKQNNGNNDNTMLDFKHPILIWWTPFSTTEGLKTCPDIRRNYHCYFTHNKKFKEHPKTSAIFFYGTDLSVDNLPLPRLKNEDWALIHEESPKNNPLMSQSSVIRMFNHTATFRFVLLTFKITKF